MAVTAALVFFAVLLFVFSLSMQLTATRRRIALRVEAFDPENKHAKAHARRERPAKTNRSPMRVHFMDNLEAALVQGEFGVAPKDFVVRWLLITLCISIFMFWVKGIIGALLVVVLSVVVTLGYIRSRGTRRRRRFEESLHDMLTIAANSLRSGYSFLQAIQVVTEDMHGPIQEEFKRVLDEMNVGVPLDTALKSSAQRIQSEDFQLIVTAILIQRQVGGNLAEVLDQIAVTIRERVRLRAEVKVLTSQGRMSGMIFMLLPIGVGGFIFVIEPSYIGILFQSPVGIVMLVVAGLMQLAGYMVIRKIVNIEL